jgi:hypothetical protein
LLRIANTNALHQCQPAQQQVKIAAPEQLSDFLTENVITAMSCNVRARQTLKTLTTI